MTLLLFRPGRGNKPLGTGADVTNRKYGDDMSQPVDHLEIARNFLAALERGAIGEELAAFFTNDVLQVELPNRLLPTGKTSNLREILAAAERGRGVVTDQRYKLWAAMEDGERVALEVEWTGTVNVAIGKLAPGDTMRAHYALFLTFRDGKIAGMRNYDCFEPF